MPIQVQLPDGTIGEFPDGMADADIERVLQRQFAPARTPAARADFSGVTGGSASTEAEAPSAVWGGANTLAPPRDARAMRSENTLAQINAQNAVDRADPAYQARYDAIDLAMRRKSFQDAPTALRFAAGAGGEVADLGRNLAETGASVADFVAPRQQTVAGLVSGVNGSRAAAVHRENELARVQDRNMMDGDSAARAGAVTADVAGNVATFAIPAARLAKLAQARNLALAARIGLQGAGAGLTEAAKEAATQSGSIDPLNVALATGGGAGGELVGAGLVAATKWARALRAGNPQAASQFAQEAGIANPSEEQLRRIAKGLAEIDAGADPRAILGREEFGFTYTRGQRELRPVEKFRELSREEALRQTAGAQPQFTRAAEQNANAMDSALNGMSERFGSRAAATPAEMVQGSAARLQQQADDLGERIRAAYSKAGEGARMAVSADSINALPQRLRDATMHFSPNPELTPATAKTLSQIKTATSSILGGIEGGNVRGVTLKALETQRRILSNNYGAAANPTDRAAMQTIKREFDGWLDEAVEGALVSGDPKALASLKDARALRAEFARRFEGTTDSDKFIAGLLDGSKTPEELLNAALGATQVSKAGGARFVERLKVAAGNDPDILGGLRAAHFDRLTRGKNGAPLPPGQVLRNISETEHSNGSVASALYTREQWGQIKRLGNALQPLVAKGDFGKSSGSGERVLRFYQQLSGAWKKLPLIKGVATHVDDVRNSYQAERTFNAPIRERHGPAHPAFPALGASTASAAVSN